MIKDIFYSSLHPYRKDSNLCNIPRKPTYLKIINHTIEKITLAKFNKKQRELFANNRTTVRYRTPSQKHI